MPAYELALPVTAPFVWRARSTIQTRSISIIIRHAALCAAAVLAACGPRDRRGDADTTAAASTRATTPNVVTETARDFAFELPDTIPAGLTTIRLVNQGPDLHHAQLVRFEEGKTLQDYQAAMRS